MTNDLATLENINLDNLDETALMALTGQGNAPATGSNNGLSRLSINYTDEDDEGNSLKRALGNSCSMVVLFLQIN